MAADPSLSGTVALVTGASSGIGAATARRLAEQGARVALAARRTNRLESLKEEIAGAGGDAIAIEADVTERSQPEDIADAISYIVTRPRHTAVNELLIRPTEQDQ